MGGIVGGISFFATFASTNTYIGHAGKAYDYGVTWFTMAMLLVVFTWIHGAESARLCAASPRSGMR